MFADLIGVFRKIIDLFHVQPNFCNMKHEKGGNQTQENASFEAMKKCNNGWFDGVTRPNRIAEKGGNK